MQHRTVAWPPPATTDMYMHQIPGVAAFLHKARNKERSYCVQQRDPWVTSLNDPGVTPSWRSREAKRLVLEHSSWMHMTVAGE